MPKPQTHKGWNPRMENLEERLAMSANPLAPGLGALETHSAIQDGPPPLNHHVQSAPDFWLDGSHSGVFADHDDQIERTLQEAHNQTGLTNVRNDYGFTGGGQTVAVIDSGIAWDHFALGGGFGSNYRVVGGWDFTENDADPYDDGPEGSHGTHVAGIVGGDSGVDNGVAPDVDLVGLRVFDDAGNGYFSWVEDALQWVHDNRNAFENPITAVNLSLGAVGWNSESIPAWANLENEFAQLEADGIFVSVSAGNSFADYNTTGLSYPAASPYVVPVMSVDDSGNLSYFSQRSTRGIAAPGRWITSTVPDYVGNNNGITDDYATFSGTSMAAPYVAGASVIIREAMEFVGYTNITQDVIYNHMKATAESFYDSATGEWFDRLDLDAAIDALMPTDEFGSTMGTAFDLGTISGDTSTNGLIGSSSDADYFTFTAGSTGTVTFDATTTHDLDASWDSSATGWTSNGGTAYTLNVTAGNTYTVGLSSSEGIGYYDLDITVESTFTYTDWGATALQQVHAGLAVSGPQWYRVVAGQSGYLTADLTAGGGGASIDLYDANLQLVQQGATADRVDVLASSGQEFFLRLDGSATGVGVRLTNAVDLIGGAVHITGGTEDNLFEFTAGAQHAVVAHGVAYSFDSASVTQFVFNGGDGNDRITINGSLADETALIQTGITTFGSDAYQIGAADFEEAYLYGGGGNDTVNFTGGNGDDVYISWSTHAVLQNTGLYGYAHGFAQTTAVGSGGYDQAVFFDSAGDDHFVADDAQAELSGSGFRNTAVGFDRAVAYASDGNDTAVLAPTRAGNDLFRSWADNRALMLGDGFYNYAAGFDRIEAFATTGSDRAEMYGGVGDDVFIAWSTQAAMHNATAYNFVKGFDETVAFSGGGYDQAVLYDSAGDDHFVADPNQAELSGDGFKNRAEGFDRVMAYGRSGHDSAVFYDSAGNDLFRSWADQRAVLVGNGFYNYAHGFDSAEAYASTGADRAEMYGSEDDDVFLAWSTHAVMHNPGVYNYAKGFDETVGIAEGGYDQAVLYDSAGDDQLVATPTEFELSGTGFRNRAEGFDRALSFASTGNDTAVFYDSAGNDLFRSWADQRALMLGNGFYNYTMGFDLNQGIASTGNDRADFFGDAGDDQITGSGDLIEAANGAYRASAAEFDFVNAYLESGGNDTVNVTAVDSAFTSYGA